MIKEAYVSFEIAKLLKERGFDSECRYVYNNDGEKIAAQNFIAGESVVNNFDIDRVGETNGWITYLQGTYAFLCPTHQMAMAWLRERYNLFFGIGFGNDCNGKFLYMIDIYDLTNNAVNGKYKPIVEADDYLTDNPKTYEEAIEAALKYTLENLI